MEHVVDYKPRTEEPWTETTEQLALEWKKRAQELSTKHQQKGKENKIKNIVTGLPLLIIPAVFSPLSVALGNMENVQYINMTGFIVTGIFSAVHTFFAFNQQYQKHIDYSARYGDVSSDIEFEMARGKIYRMPHDEFLTRIQYKLDSLDQNAPDLF